MWFHVLYFVWICCKLQINCALWLAGNSHISLCLYALIPPGLWSLLSEHLKIDYRILDRLTLWAWQNSSRADLDPALSPVCHNAFFSVPTLSQQSHFMWLWAGGRGRYFSQTLCVYPLIPEKKFTSMRKVLGDLSTSQTCSVCSPLVFHRHTGLWLFLGMFVKVFFCVILRI